VKQKKSSAAEVKLQNQGDYEKNLRLQNDSKARSRTHTHGAHSPTSDGATDRRNPMGHEKQ
jgi:hypothetical protein